MTIHNTNNLRGSFYSVVVNVLDCDIVVCEFEFQPRYKVHFWINIIGKGLNVLIPLAIDEIELLMSYKDSFGIK